MLLLPDLVRKAVTLAGQIVIPISDYGYESGLLEEIFEVTVGEYQEYRPIERHLILDLVEQQPFPIPNCQNIYKIRYDSGLGNSKLIKPLSNKFYDFNTNTRELTMFLSGRFNLECLFDININYPSISENVYELTEFEDKIKFKLKSNFKRGTLKIYVLNKLDNIQYSVTDDISSYNEYSANFTVDTINNVIIIPEAIGKKLKTGSKLLFETDDTLPTNLNSDNYFFVIKESDISFKIAINIFNALNNIPITLVNTGTGTHSFKTVLSTTEIDLLGNLGSGTFNTENQEINIDLNESIEGFLIAEYKSLFKGTNDLHLNNDLFLNLFKANLIISLGNNKSLLQLDELEWDFSLDDLVSQGQTAKESYIEDLRNKGKWWKWT